jgi:hypothetical protein
MVALPLHVEIGSGSTVELRYGDLTLSLTSEAAALVGRALIAASSAVSSPAPPSAGFHVVDAHLPVIAWKTGVSNVNLEPILMLEVAGGLWLSFQLPAKTALDVGSSLSATSSTTVRPAGQLPN